MRLLSLNVALFETNNSQLVDFLKSQKADILCLQEVAEKIDTDVNSEYISKDYIDKAAYGLRYSFFGPTWIVKDFQQENFHKKKNFNFDFGGFLKSGNYVKSKFKIKSKQNIFINNTNIKVTDWSTWPKVQSKAVQVIDLELPESKKLRVLNYHGIWTREKIGNAETYKACQKILALAKEADCPVIITGDFNLFPETESMKVFKYDFISLIDEHKISTTRPKSNELSHLERNVVDYILVNKDVKVQSFRVLDTDISDHLPLILDFEV